MTHKTKPIQVKKSQRIGSGSFADVYRISPRRVVKVFRPDEFDKDTIKEFITDEIEVSKGNGHLPVLRVVKVKYPETGEITPGLIKRYIPYEAKKEDRDTLEVSYWDDSLDNIRKDSRGNVFIIDSQSDDVMRYV